VPRSDKGAGTGREIGGGKGRQDHFTPVVGQPDLVHIIGKTRSPDPLGAGAIVGVVNPVLRVAPPQV